MRISGWHIDGFGTFESFSVGDIPPGLTVFSGPNEAGKSTLLAFIRGMLFAMPGSIRKRAYAPLRGGNHGGRIFLDLEDGSSLVVERHAATRGVAQVTVDGNPRSDHDLRAALGGCDEDVFRSVFAFGLSELQRMDSLDRGAIGERIFSAGVVGAGRSAHAVLKDLGDRKTKLLKQTRGNATINDLIRDLDVKSTQIAAAGRMIGTHDDLVRRIEETNARIAHFAVDLEQMRTARERSVLLGNLWPIWHERRETAVALASYKVDDQLNLVAPDVDDLERDLPRFRDWQERHRVAEAKRLAAERALEDQLRDLGPAWDRTTLAAFDRSIPRTEEVHRHSEAITEHRLARDAAENDARIIAESSATANRTAAESAALVAELTLPPTREELDQRADSIRTLRALNADLAAAESRVDAANANVATIERTKPSVSGSDPFSGTTVGYGLGLAAAVLLGMAVWQGLTGALSVSVVLGILAAGLAYLAVMAIQRAAPMRAEAEAAQRAYTTSLAIAKSELSGYLARAEEIRAGIAAGAARVGLTSRPTNHDVEDADRRVSHDEDNYRVYVQETRRAAKEAETARERSAEAATARAQAESNLGVFNETVATWNTWKSIAGVPQELSPQGVLDFFDRVRIGREVLLTLEEAERDSASASARTDEYVARATTILAASGQAQRGTEDIGEAVQDLARAIAQDRNLRTEMQDLQQTIDRCDRSITDALGEGDLASAMRDELAQGDVDRWRTQAISAGDELATIEAERVVAIEAKTKAMIDRDEIEASSDIARFELERAALLEELQSAVHEWRVISTAEALVKDTLQQFELERQPEVLQHASRLFQVITDGEYVRLFRPISDVAGLSIETRHGGIVSPEALSQGTREQLYLCIRLGLAADHAKRTTSLPLVMDDVLVNFDPARARAVASALCSFSQDHQVLLFTCHPHTVDLLRSIHPGCKHFTMQRHGVGGEWAITAESNAANVDMLATNSV